MRLFSFWGRWPSVKLSSLYGLKVWLTLCPYKGMPCMIESYLTALICSMPYNTGKWLRASKHLVFVNPKVLWAGSPPDCKASLKIGRSIARGGLIGRLFRAARRIRHSCRCWSEGGRPEVLVRPAYRFPKLLCCQVGSKRSFVRSLTKLHHL